MPRVLIPVIKDDWWTIACCPELGPLSRDGQQVMDFGIWQAADRSWQLGACVRGTAVGGKGRILFRWQSDSLKAAEWQAAGVLMVADSAFGETPGGLQAPYVVNASGRYFMFYGDWENICLATGYDGKTFARWLNEGGVSRIASHTAVRNARDPMVLSHDGRYYLYYTGVDGGIGAIYARYSEDLRLWSDATVVSRGGSGGFGENDAECAYVHYMPDSGCFYLFRWHSAGQTNVYCSFNPLDFGVDHDDKKVAELPVEVARVVTTGGQSFISSLHSDYTGIKLSTMSWELP